MCAIAGSFNAAVVGCPPDVIKTRTMNNRTTATKIGYLTLARQIYQKEGLRAFYKGVDALFFRLSCWNCIMFMTLEQIKYSFYDPTLPD